jgi:hypothetical protein
VLGTAYAATMAFSALQKSILQQRALAQTMDFKLIPAEPTQLSFRPEDFK